ncbi:pitrilysin family protein [Nannocystis sp.]|uniref:M16 family metallopeptidase n=1 Tax=Nannocystis sp. TaxID=1962667 RepID=UPI002429CDB7|nr:pitrilysin family protein [Nannocystis sp.]MBK7827847.1 insulinase family protein [Nannocystis sp.]MBK9752624.1 insulinase family protein [Nannocystis sp.]
MSLHPSHGRTRRRAVAVALCLLAAPALADAAPAPATTAAPATAKVVKKGKAQSGPGFDLPIQNFELANGLRVFVVEDHSTPSFNMTLLYDVGSRDEVQGRTGFAHLFEHMMFEGSKNVPPMGHLTFVQRVGGNNNAGTSYDMTMYYNNLPSQYLELGLWLESDRLRSLEITDANFENQRKAVKEEKAMRMDNVPYSGAIQNWLSDAWKGTGYGHTVIGSLEDLEAAQTPDVQAFFDKYYSPNNAVLVFVGDIDFADLKAKVEKYFGDIKRGPERPPTPTGAVDKSKPFERSVEDPLAQQALYLLGWHTVGQTHPDRYALDLLGNILLVGESARIPKILQDEKKLVAFAGGAHFSQRDAGLVFVQAMPLPTSNFDAIKQVIRDEVTKMQKSGISARELQKAINSEVMGTVSTLATNQGRASSIATGALFYNDPKRVLTDLQKYQEVTPADIKRVANEYLGANWLTLEIKPAAGKANMMGPG